MVTNLSALGAAQREERAMVGCGTGGMKRRAPPGICDPMET
jgi:hypothetical protein